MWRDRLLYPELRTIIKRLGDGYTDTNKTQKPNPKSGYKPDMLLIEDTAAGRPLIYDLRKLDVNAVAFNPKPYGDKMQRVITISHYIENGLFYVAGEPPDFEKPRPMADDFITQCEMFPKADSRDIVDCLSQFMIYHKHLFVHSDDYVDDTPKYGERVNFYGVE
jgi:predicted phage terminase large subunit-like protein